MNKYMNIEISPKGEISLTETYSMAWGASGYTTQNGSYGKSCKIEDVDRCIAQMQKKEITKIRNQIKELRAKLKIMHNLKNNYKDCKNE